jgi:hypothetical protein
MSDADTNDTAESTILAYYEALRSGEPIHPFFADDGPIVKVGIGDRMVGAGAVADGLREQTRTTTDWVVESRDLHVGAVGGGGVGTVGDDAIAAGSGDESEADPAFAWFGDEVFMGWTDTDRTIRFEFDTRWSGALARLDGGWRFVEMHVSTPGET